MDNPDMRQKALDKNVIGSMWDAYHAQYNQIADILIKHNEDPTLLNRMVDTYAGLIKRT